MKRRTFLGLTAFALSPLATSSCKTRPEPTTQGSSAVVGDGLVVHEWGTFTSFQNANGVAIDGLQHEGEALPPFVHESLRARASPFAAFGDSSRDLRLGLVNHKMETPVLYFYTNTPKDARVHVDFKGGLLTQWYPEAKVTPTAEAQASQSLAGEVSSSLDWDVHLTPFGEACKGAPPEVAASTPWAFARETRAATVQTKGGETERYLFYRGLGRLRLPLAVGAANADGVTLAPIPLREEAPAPSLRGVFVLDVRASEARFVELGEPLDNMPKQLEWKGIALRPKEVVVRELERAVAAALVREGLFEDEARAMVRTWSRTWFAEEGTRALYMIPRAVTDAILPIAIEPAPTTLVRVMVGRLEYLTEEELQRATDDVRATLDPKTEHAAMERLAKRGRFLEPVLKSVHLATTNCELHRAVERLLERFA